MPHDTTGNARTMRARRIRLGLSLQALADRCAAEGAPINRSQLSQIERGRVQNPRPRTRFALAKILNLDPLEIGTAGEPTKADSTDVDLREVRQGKRADASNVLELRG